VDAMDQSKTSGSSESEADTSAGAIARATAVAAGKDVQQVSTETQSATAKTGAAAGDQHSQGFPIVSSLDEPGPIASKAAIEAQKTGVPRDGASNVAVENAQGAPTPELTKDSTDPLKEPTDVLGKPQIQLPVQGVVTQGPAHFSTPASAQQAQVPAAAHFAQDNHASIISGVRASLLPHGGSMQIRLDPPELGALQVSVEMRDGVMNATFQTSNDDATRLLSHSLGQLKSALESQGVTVEKIQVQQAPRDQRSQNSEDHRQGRQFDDRNAQQEQQRREVLRRMWRRISGGHDPVDLVA
jgi:flagellar hook-length control protein FliK